MHVVRARPRHIHGETQLQARMRTTIGMVESQMVMTLSKPGMWGSMRPTHGVFSICTVMSLSGLTIGTKRPILPVTQ